MTQIAYFSLIALAVALPWEVFQRLPAANLTVSKVAGLMVIVCACAACLVRRPLRAPRLGIGAPVTVLGLACAISITYSVDRGASLRQMVVYVAYFAFIVSAAFYVQQASISRHLMHCYIVSASVVAALTIAAYAGWVWPTTWQTAYTPLQRLLLEYRDGVPMRMAAASTDFNQAAMLLLVGFVASLFLYQGTPASAYRKIGLHSAQLLIMAAILVSMSRSAALIAGVFTVYWLLVFPKRRGIAIVTAAVLCAAGFLAVGLSFEGFWETFFHRAQGGLAHDDPSIRGRWQVYRIGISLLPQYGLWGCGLGAIDTAMSTSRFADQAVMTLHSLPMIFLLEIGVVGFVAYIWLVVRVFKTVRQWSSDAPVQDCATGRALTAVLMSVVVMTTVQPFPFLPLYPFLIAIACGPLNQWVAEQRALGNEQDFIAISRRSTRSAALIVSLLVAINFVSYQSIATRFVQIADALSAGIAAERAADWLHAAEHYRTAAALAERVDDASTAAMARALVDPDPLLLAMNIPRVDTPLRAAAWYCIGRAWLAQGDLVGAQSAFEIARVSDPRFYYLQFDLAEALWGTGAYAEAIQLYAEAAKVASKHLSETQLNRIEPIKSRADTATAGRVFFSEDNHWRAFLPGRLDALAQARDESGLLEKAAILRRLGRWNEAVAVYEDTLANFPESADAVFHLGVQKQLEGRLEEAERMYRTALRISPGHIGAAARIASFDRAGRSQS